MTPAPAAPDRAAAAAARDASFVVFGANGLVMATWISRIPTVKSQLDLSAGRLGLVLLCLSFGACSALPAAGAIEHRFGAARTVAAFAGLSSLGLAIVGLGVSLGSAGLALVVVGLVLTGLGAGVWDVAMNVHGAAVEQSLGRALMPRLHAGFSLGTVVGALLGAATLHFGLPTVAHLGGVAVAVALAVRLSVRRFLLAEPPAADAPSTRSAVAAAWRDPRTLAIGFLTLSFAFTEGTANEWLGVSVVEGLRAGEAVGALAFGVFVTAMTIGRWFGTPLLDRFGRVACLRVTALSALAGLLLVSLGGGVGFALAGAVLWGLGASLGFPVGMSAAADDPRTAGARVGVVSAISYSAFLGGPPVVGFLADQVGLLHALLAVLVTLAAALLLAGAAHPLSRVPATRPRDRFPAPMEP